MTNLRLTKIDLSSSPDSTKVSASVPPRPLRFAAARILNSEPPPASRLAPPPEPPRLPRLIDAASQVIDGTWSALRGIGLNIYEGLSGIGSGLLDVFSGDLTGGLSSLFKGLFATVVQTPLDALLSFGGHLAFGAMTALGMTPARRKLDQQEREDLQKIFGASLDLDKIRIQEGPSWVFKVSHAGAFVIGDTIHVPGKISSDILAHEAMHVWQHQNGGTDYLSEALWAQWTKPGGGYFYADDVAKGVQWDDLSPEQQGKVVEHLFPYWANIEHGERIVARYVVFNGREELVDIQVLNYGADVPSAYFDITTLRDSIRKSLS